MKRNCASSCIVLLAICLTSPARATDHEILVAPSGFAPGYLEIQVGDTVTWRNDDALADYHDTSCPEYPWHSPQLYYGYRAYMTFTRPGIFAYACDHCTFTGAIVVRSGNWLPVPVLSRPARLADGRFQFTATNLLPGTTCVVETSTNLARPDWSRCHTNTASGFGHTFTDAATNGAQRFYRVFVVP